MKNFNQPVRQVLGEELKSSAVQTIQVNLGLRCNLSCRHCHVEGSPQRTEVMTWETMQSVLRLAEALPQARASVIRAYPAHPTSLGPQSLLARSLDISDKNKRIDLT
jgi:sulfatase maturation enzyme AslB (radical SAM superfamily)